MIETKVANILSPTKVVLAAGTEQGVRVGMTFVIYELGEEVKDPENGASLGRLELHKAEVKVNQVQPKVSVAATIAKEVTRDWPPLYYPRKEIVYPTLPLDDSTATALAQRKLTVKVGDLARNTA